jgi:Family of unknown function (DUF5670)
VLWTLVVVFFLLWLLGLVAVGGNLVHLLLVCAIILIIYNLATRGRVT